MSIDNLDTLALDYFDAWNKHDVARIMNFFIDDTLLINWREDSYGLDIIKNEYTNLFKKHPNIRIHICRITTIPKDLVAICEIFIYVNKDDKSPQQSVSIMTFNDDRKIKRIHTYTG